MYNILYILCYITCKPTCLSSMEGEDAVAMTTGYKLEPVEGDLEVVCCMFGADRDGCSQCDRILHVLT